MIFTSIVGLTLLAIAVFSLISIADQLSRIADALEAFEEDEQMEEPKE